MTRRERFASVLDQFQLCPPSRGVLSEIAKPIHVVILDALDAACVGELDRDRLEAILRRHLSANLDYRTSVHKPFIDDLLAWATGATEPKWCEHIKWEKGTDLSQSSCRYSGWYLQNSHSINILIDSSWKQCPICTTPRPAGA